MMFKVIWFGIYIILFTSPSYQLSDYASDPKVLEAVEPSDNRAQPNPNWPQLPNVPKLNSPQTNMIPSSPGQGGFPQDQGQQLMWPSSGAANFPGGKEAVEPSDNRVQPNPNWAQLPNVPQLNSPLTNMIPSTPMQGGAPQGQGQQSLWPSVGAANFGGGPAMGTNPLSPVDFSGAQNPLMMGPNFLPPGALNVPGAQNPQMMGPNPLTPGALNFPGAQNPQMMGPNPLKPGALNFPGAPNPQMMGPNPLTPGALNFPGAQNPHMMGPNPLMPGAFNLPGAQNPQMMGPNPFLKPGAFNFPEVSNPLMPGMHGHLPFAG